MAVAATAALVLLAGPSSLMWVSWLVPAATVYGIVAWIFIGVLRRGARRSLAGDGVERPLTTPPERRRRVASTAKWIWAGVTAATLAGVAVMVITGDWGALPVVLLGGAAMAATAVVVMVTDWLWALSTKVIRAEEQTLLANGPEAAIVRRARLLADVVWGSGLAIAVLGSIWMLGLVTAEASMGLPPHG